MTSKSKRKKTSQTNSGSGAGRNTFSNEKTRTRTFSSAAYSNAAPAKDQLVRSREAKEASKAIFLVMFIITGMIGSAVLFHKDDNKKPGSAAIPGLSGVVVQDSEGQNHVSDQQKVAYRTQPPLSGNHYATGIPWALYSQPQIDERLVHNLAVGGVVIYYNCPSGCKDTLSSLHILLDRYPGKFGPGIAVVPRSDLPEGSKFVLTAWQHRLDLADYDSNTAKLFINFYLSKGPENSEN